MMLLVGCQATGGKVKEVSLTPGQGQIKAPWANFPEGSWVLYKVLSPTDGMEYEYRESIHRIANGQGVIVKSMRVGDKWQKVGMEPVSLLPIGKPGDKTRATATVKVGNKELICKVVDMPIKMGETTTSVKNYMCDEIPGGLAVREMGGKEVRKVIDFGTTNITPGLEEVVQIKAPWAGFPKGTWIKYKVVAPDGKETMFKATLVEVNDEKGIVETSELVGENWEKKDAHDVSLLPIPRSARQSQLTMLKIGEKGITCSYIDMTYRIGDMATVMKQWMSEDVPGGMVRKEMAGRCVWEVVDFGTK
ncbi:MAG: hypothetical protein WC980_05675 [Candidatus Brocadiia bacterium]